MTVGERPRRWWSRAVVALLVIIAAGAGWWARGVTLADQAPDEGSVAGEPVLAEVVPTSVGRSMTLGVTVRQPLQTVAVNHLSGVVTAVGGGDVDVGDLLFEVGGTPVVAVQGERPFHRDLSPGAEGEDVAQLQQALADLGYADAEPDGRLGDQTAAAVRRWQEDLGLTPSGVVRLGEVAALRVLPSAVSIDEAIALGARVNGGEPAVRAPTGERSFVLVLAQNQQALIPVGATVTIPYGEHEWEAVVASSATDAQLGQVEMELIAPDGGAVCGQDCDVLPADEALTILSTVIAVPPVEGLGAPAAAVRSRADASTYVLLDDGSEQDVTVLGAGQGMVVLDGVVEGQLVQLSASGGGESGGDPQPGGADPATDDESAG